MTNKRHGTSFRVPDGAYLAFAVIPPSSLLLFAAFYPVLMAFGYDGDIPLWLQRVVAIMFAWSIVLTPVCASIVVLRMLLVQSPEREKAA